MSNEKESLLEETFRLIGEGRSHELNKEWWKAAQCFVRARDQLSRLAQMEQDEVELVPVTSSINTTNPEHGKIATLYRQQAFEYLCTAQSSLIKAMEEERDEHEKRGNVVIHPPSNSTMKDILSDEEAKERLVLFASLFSKTDILQSLSASNRSTTSTCMVEATPLEPSSTLTMESLEERLQRLSQSVPKNLQSTDERMRDINRGLNRLGLSVYSNTETTSRLYPVATAPDQHLSEEEQTAQLMAQAYDEVALLATSTSQDRPILENSLMIHNIQKINDLMIRSETEQVDDLIAQAYSEVDSAAMLTKMNNINSKTTEEEDEEINHIKTLSIVNEDGSTVTATTTTTTVQVTPEFITALQDKILASQTTLAELIAMLELNHSNNNDNAEAIVFDPVRGRHLLQQARILLQQASQIWSS